MHLMTVSVNYVPVKSVTSRVDQRCSTSSTGVLQAIGVAQIANPLKPSPNHYDDGSQRYRSGGVTQKHSEHPQKLGFDGLGE